MISFGFTTIVLATYVINRMCQSCGHNQQQIQAIRYFFELFYIPMFPLKKTAQIACPQCGAKTNLNSFLRNIEEGGKDADQLKVYIKNFVKKARVPLYIYIAPSLALMFVVGCLIYGEYEELNNLEQAKVYAQSPTENALILCKADGETYPYYLVYIPKIQGQDLVLLEWNYCYENAKDGKNALKEARKAILEDTVSANFHKSYYVSKDALSTVAIVQVDPIQFSVDWEKFLPEEEAKEKTSSVSCKEPPFMK